MRLIIISLCLIAWLSGCAPPRQIVITDINDSSVKLYVHPAYGNQWPTQEQVQAEAQRGCAHYDKRASEVSGQCIVEPGVIFTICQYKIYLYSCD